MSRPLAILVALSASSSILWGSQLQAEQAPRRASGTNHPSTESNGYIYADSFLVWIYARPERDPAPIGYLRAGQSTRLRSLQGAAPNQRVRGGCGKGWFAVEPAGFICLDHAASLVPTRYSESMAKLAPREGPYPFDYALSMGTPSYRRVPEPKEWERREREFGEAKPKPLPPHWQGHEELVTDDDLSLSPMPDFLQAKGSVSRSPEKRLERRDVPFGSMLAITGSFEQHGRQFLQSADGTVVPAKRMRLFKRSTFEGLELNTNAQAGPRLPLAWPRKAVHHYRLGENAECTPQASASNAKAQPRRKAGGTAAPRAPGRLDKHPARIDKNCLISTEKVGAPRKAIQLTGRAVEIAGTRFAETAASEGSTWLPTGYLYLAEGKSAAGKRNADGQPIEADGSVRKWIHFSIGQGTLVSYVGNEPVFATLASPGIGGVPALGADPLDTRTTPVGTYRIHFKHVSDDMSPEQTEHRKFWIADVPYAMYFKQPFAIHVAYWHESFGEPMSGGCINVSPRDGQRLFNFTGPALPLGWYGVGSSPGFGYGTTVVIDR